MTLKLEKSTSEPGADGPSLMSPVQMPLPEWNNTSRDYPQDLLVTQLVSQRAQEMPDALALQSETQSLTYRQLESRSNQLARYLQSLGIGAEMLLGICLPRTPEMVVAALAVMKAGAAYIPIDAECPVSRLHFMLRDAQVRLLITDQKTSGNLPSGNWQVLTMQSAHADVASQPDTPPSVSIGVQNLAYAIYTSGSTGGQPKAALITHRGLLNLMYWHCRAFSVTPADRASQIASFGFDAAVWEIWPYLATGASVHFPEDATRSSVESLRDWLLVKQITISFAPTALAESLIALEWPEKTPLRLLLTGADTLRRYPPASLPFGLINNYGPTESTVVATSGRVLPEPQLDRQPTIGRPIDNVQAYILDADLLPVPLGSVGELYLGGAGLARGYLNRPQQEAEAFIRNPFSDLPGDRLYRTGDLGRYLANGQIVFVGRSDEQIKIRGYRIEPNEIASLINQYPGVQASVVTARADQDGDKRLLAYLVSSDLQLNRGALQEFLRAQLPDYMVPVAFVRLASLPLNSSGKLDRAALPAPTLLNTIAGDEFMAPSNPIEEQVVSILAELLELEKVGVNDNFFFLGGHSLLGTQLIARVRNVFGVELSLRTVFDSPTAAGLANEIECLLSRQQEISAD
jgi:amino acid adenylation domain-containing protein